MALVSKLTHSTPQTAAFMTPITATWHFDLLILRQENET